MKDVLERGFTVFPVVSDGAPYQKAMPDFLYPINATAFDIPEIARDVISGFRLTRRLRQAFISYRRTEATGIANQLFHELTDRRYKPFLDTVSIDAGVDFQGSLWSRMADVDLVILLDSPTALDSTWVHAEFNRAHDLGMGVVQLVWPGKARTPGTEFSVPVWLTADDFVGDPANGSSIITAEVLAKIVDIVEDARIRSLCTRRTRLVEGVISTANPFGLTLVSQPNQHVELIKAGSKVGELIPFVGVPDSFSLHNHEIAMTYTPTFIIYNGLGVERSWIQHLAWLNNKSNVEVVQIDDLITHIGTL